MSNQDNTMTLTENMITDARNMFTHAQGMIQAPARLRGAVRRLLRSAEETGHDRRLTSGRFDRRALLRASRGEQDVFARKWHIQGQNVALTLLIDLSSSMQQYQKDRTGRKVKLTSRAQAACALAVALSQAAEQARAQVNVLGFWPDDYARTTTCQLVEIKATRERVSSPDTQIRLGMIPQLANAGTALAPAIIQCAEMLDNHPHATRRLLMVLSDGVCTYGSDACAMAIRLAEKQHRTEVIGFALACGSLQRMFNGKVIDVDNLSEISVTALESLAKKLERHISG